MRAKANRQRASLRLAAAVASASLLGSCQPEEIRALAGFQGTRLTFTAADGEPHGCWRRAELLDEALGVAWAFEGDGLGDCGPLLPLRYGAAPPRTRDTVPARPLEPGRLYVLLGDATSTVHGGFLLTRTGKRTSIQNFDPNAPAVRAIVERRWRQRDGRAAPGLGAP